MTEYDLNMEFTIVYHRCSVLLRYSLESKIILMFRIERFEANNNQELNLSIKYIFTLTVQLLTLSYDSYNELEWETSQNEKQEMSFRISLRCIKTKIFILLIYSDSELSFHLNGRMTWPIITLFILNRK